MKHISKFHAAEDQLLDALKLYVDARYISAATLAGAAEEIFSKLLSARGENNSLDSAHEMENSIFIKLKQKSVSKNSTGKNLFRLRNDLKHIDMNRPGNTIIKFRLSPDIESQVLRALHDYQKLKKGRVVPTELLLAIQSFRRAYWHNNSSKRDAATGAPS